MNYYKVAAKCGHVGRNHYIIKNFYVTAGDGKSAAKIVRFMPRVKHHWKDAIIDVVRIDEDEFIVGKEMIQDDLYFLVKNSSEQRLYGAVDSADICERDIPEFKTKDKDSIYYNKLMRIYRKDCMKQLREVI